MRRMNNAPIIRLSAAERDVARVLPLDLLLLGGLSG